MSGNLPHPPLSSTRPPTSDLVDDVALFSYDWNTPGNLQEDSSDPSSTTASESSNPFYESHVDTAKQTPNPKIAIPRATNTKPISNPGRVSRACVNCREQKVKCSGHRPTCHRCQMSDVTCIYGDRKREKMVKQLDDLTAQVETYENLLRNIYLHPDHHPDTSVNQSGAADAHSQPLSQISTASLASTLPRRGSDNANTPSYTRSHVDFVDEDFNRDAEAQATGFIGGHSAIKWLHQLMRFLEEKHPTPGSLQKDEDIKSLSSVNYFLDESGIVVSDNVTIMERPSQAIADQLVDNYFSVTHESFPFLGKGLFISQCRAFYSKSNLRPGRRWMAVLNMVFAIGARHSCLASCHALHDHDGREEHAVYFSRAWQLNTHDAASFSHPNLQQVQVEALASFYLLSLGQVNRAWRMCGIAVRSAQAMGIQLRDESPSTSNLSKEARYRLWWGLYLLNNLVSGITGRPFGMQRADCATPLPVPYREEEFGEEHVMQLLTNSESRRILMSSLHFQLPRKDMLDSPIAQTPIHVASREEGRNEQARATAAQYLSMKASLYFTYSVDLAAIMEEAIGTLFSQIAAPRSWLQIELATSALNESAERWLSRLPVSYQFTGSGVNRPDVLQHTSLAFQFYSTRLVITQPCLHRVVYGAPEDGPPSTLCSSMAATCIQVAGQILDLLPSDPDVAWLYECSPWWCMLHYIMQSVTVLMMNLVVRPKEGTAESANIGAMIRKAILWLSNMATKDPAAMRARLLCIDILSRHGLRPSMEIDAEF
ncbi:hypothetical protein PENANT_c012G01330 [Penicillium antarcticum]|uniref:Zn(2)-C6 fungal-type domain-containing protein n=2 Tax=Penicillium antarcticum TaxID=416450 RepID=A0A1V6Q5N7_9EURO|nr:hypothetical protein PENANT_c012G01330 [Penicillium antarcticum]